MSNKTEVIELENNVKAVLKSVSGEQLKRAVLAGGQVIEAYAKINVERTFSSKSTGGAGLAGSIQTVVSKSTEHSAEVEVGPTVIYGRIRELGGLILPVHAKKLSWLIVGGSGGNKQKAGGKIFVSGNRVFADWLQVFPSPYLRPAADEHKDDIRDAVGYQLMKQIEDAT